MEQGEASRISCKILRCGVMRPRRDRVLERLTFTSKRPTALYYYRELQNLRDPLNFQPAPTEADLRGPVAFSDCFSTEQDMTAWLWLILAAIAFVIWALRVEASSRRRPRQREARWLHECRRAHQDR